MNPSDDDPAGSLKTYEHDPNEVHSLDDTASLVEVTRHTILVYYKHGLVSPAVDPDQGGGYYFNDDAIRNLRRIEYLRNVCGVSLTGVKMIIKLMGEVDGLRKEVRFLRK